MTASLDQAQLRRILEVGRSLVGDLDLESVLKRVLAAARELTGARYAALGVLDDRKLELERFLFVGIDEELRRQIGPLPRGRGVLGELIRHPRPLRLKDVRDHPRSYGFPSGHPPMTSFLGTPIEIRGEVFGNLYLTDKEGAAEFSHADERLTIVLAEWAAVAIDNARLYERAERRRVELEQAVRGLQATASLAREIGSETELPRILELVAKRGRALVDARSLLVLLRVGAQLAVVERAGDAGPETRGRPVLDKTSPVAAAYHDGEARRLTAGQVARLRDLDLDPAPGLLCPLRHHGRTLGVLFALGRMDGDPFTADDELVLGSFAATASTGIALAQMVESERRLLSIAASEGERRRWARELHDETLQELGALRLMHDTALANSDPEIMRRALAHGSEQLEHTITMLEALIADLRPATLDELGVAAALETLVKRVERQHELPVELECDLAYESGRARARYLPELETSIYRLVQEALNNAVKHADASRVRVAVREDEHDVSVAVSDDGSGFDPAAAESADGFGLLGMRERAGLAGGMVEIDSAPGAGTTVRARLPIEREGMRPRARESYIR